MKAKDINNIIIEVATEILSEEYREGYLKYLENEKRINKRQWNILS